MKELSWRATVSLADVWNMPGGLFAGPGAQAGSTPKSSIRLTDSHPHGSVGRMRRAGKILVCVVASLAAAITTYYGMWFGLQTWARLGATTFVEADMPKLVMMFEEATTLPAGGGQVFLELNRATRIGTRRIGINPSQADRNGASRHAETVWRELGWAGGVTRASGSHEDKVATDVVVSFADQDRSWNREYFPADSVVHQVGWADCSIQLALSQDRRRILQAATMAAVGTLPPFWRPAIAPCVTRGLFASAGLVGDTCIVRPSVLCGRDNLNHGTAVDYFLLRVLHVVHSQQPPSAEAIQSAVRATMAQQLPYRGFSNRRGQRVSYELFLVNRWIKDRFYTEEEQTALFLKGQETWWERWLLL